MGWTESIGAAINYIEEHLCEELTPEIIAQKAAVSSFYFQKGFAMLCGMSIGEYIRGRRSKTVCPAETENKLGRWQYYEL